MVMLNCATATFGEHLIYLLSARNQPLVFCVKKAQIIIHKSTALDISVNSSLITHFKCSEKLADILCHVFFNLSLQKKLLPSFLQINTYKTLNETQGFFRYG